MNFKEALDCLKQGQCVALPEWKGYWFMKDNIIFVRTQDGCLTKTPWISLYIARTDWSVIDIALEEDIKTCTFNFGIATDFLNEGKCLCRKGWNGKNMFICKQMPCTLEGLIIEKVQSLPTEAKNILIERGTAEQTPKLAYTNQCLIINADGRADSWICSISDMFADDWMLYGGK